jgi:hypothetical protein
MAADTHRVKTTPAATNRVTRTGLIALVVVVAAFALLMIVRSGVLGGSSSDSAAGTKPSTPAQTPSAHATAPSTPVRPKVVLLPGLPASVAHALRYSRVAVVSLYFGQAQADRPWVAEARKGARAAGAGFVAVNLGSDKTAASVKSFVGPVSPPSMLVVRRPGKIVTQMAGPVESAVVAQAAHNAGARR